MRDPDTLVEALEGAARHHPERGIAVFDGRGRHADRRRFPELLAAARRTAERLAAAGVGAGDRVVICLPSSWEWLDAWWGAVLLGALPVGMAPGAVIGTSESHLRKMDGVVEQLGARLLIGSPALVGELAGAGAGAAAAVATALDGLPAAGAAPPWHRPRPEEAAFLQLTSGSTGLPRAVTLSHRAVVHCTRAIEQIGVPPGAAGRERFEALVAWLPLYHDMGLVGLVLRAVFFGWDLWLLPPQAFLARPRVWLDLLGSRGSTQTAAPNFGYQLCVERLAGEPLGDLDLSSWGCAICGAEMVRPSTMAAFVDTFGPAGFRAESLVPCYGMAETVVGISFDRRLQGPRTRPLPAGGGAAGTPSEVVCLGEPLVGSEVQVTAPDGSDLGEDRVGEIRVRGPHLFSGYWGDPAATAEALVDGWLRTGDLGFLHAGEVYVTGRLKELLIVRGENLMPHDLEQVAEAAVGGGGSHRAGAFSVARGETGEEAVLAVEVSEREPAALAEVERRVRVAVGRELGLPLADVVLVRRGRIPKTTSGKLQRGELRRLYLEGGLERLDRAGPG